MKTECNYETLSQQYFLKKVVWIIKKTKFKFSRWIQIWCSKTSTAGTIYQNM